MYSTCDSTCGCVPPPHLVITLNACSSHTSSKLCVSVDARLGVAHGAGVASAGAGGRGAAGSGPARASPTPPPRATAPPPCTRPARCTKPAAAAAAAAWRFRWGGVSMGECMAVARRGDQEPLPAPPRPPSPPPAQPLSRARHLEPNSFEARLRRPAGEAAGSVGSAAGALVAAVDVVPSQGDSLPLLARHQTPLRRYAHRRAAVHPDGEIYIYIYIYIYSGRNR